MSSNTDVSHRSRGRLGAYELLSTLGVGGFGKVYLGEHVHLHTRAAVKVLHADVVDVQAEQFKREAQVIAQLSPHPHIVRVLDYNIQNGHPYIVMDYAPHGNLRQRHTFGERVPLDRVVSYANQIASGLQHIHNLGVIHCDVKPENMFVGSQGEVLIGDFGIAIALQEENAQNEDTFGTISYMAPEQIFGHLQPQSDQYALAVVVYEWLTGQLPFAEFDRFEIAQKHLYEQPQSMRAIDPTIPLAVDQVVMRALSKDPSQRYSSISQFAGELRVAAERSAEKETSFSTTWYKQLLEEYEQVLCAEGSTEQEIPLEEDAPLPILIKGLTKPYIEKAFAHLSWVERSCLLLHIDAQFAPNEIAQILSIEERNVSEHLENGRRQLLYTYYALLEKEQGISLRQVSAAEEENISRVERLIEVGSRFI